MKKSKLKNIDAEGVVVSSNLQAAFIFFVFSAQAMSTLSYFWTLTDANGVATRAWVEQLIYLLFPAILVGTAYVYTKKHRSSLNRLFLATVKAVCAFSFYAILSTLNTQIAISYAQTYSNIPPAWLTSFWNMIVLMALSYAAFVGVLHFWMYDKKGR